MAIKRIELTNPNGCLGKAADDEPLFVLRANDELAPDVVREWASRYHASKGGTIGMTEWQLGKYYEALNLANDMAAWKAAHK